METLLYLKEFIGDRELFEEMMKRSDNSPMMILHLVREHEEQSGENCTGDAIDWLFDKRSSFSVIDAYEGLMNHEDFYPGIINDIYREVIQ